MAYGQCQRVFCLFNNKTDNEELTFVENMAAGSIAAVFASLALCPIELVKCRLQTMNEMPLNIENQMRKTM
jgi:solute carrier family 25 ornithine transporter 2/15